MGMVPPPLKAHPLPFIWIVATTAPFSLQPSLDRRAAKKASTDLQALLVPSWLSQEWGAGEYFWHVPLWLTAVHSLALLPAYQPEG